MLRVRRRLRRTWKYLASYLPSRSGRDSFPDVRTFCMFIGTPRSGHSLVGSLIDAHPNAIIAHELNVLHYLRSGATRNQIYALLVRNSRRHAEEGRTWTGYSYAVPNQWQGRYTELHVIGDKKGGSTTKQLRAHPKLLDQLYRTVDVPIRFVHVLRNPYDNISTIAKRSGRPLQDAIDYYFGLCAANAALRDRLGETTVHEVRYESLIADPTGSLHRLCGVLGLIPGEDYLRDCAGIVYASPRKTRFEQDWPEDLLDAVRRRIDEFPMLRGYAYEET